MVAEMRRSLPSINNPSTQRSTNELPTDCSSTGSPGWYTTPEQSYTAVLYTMVESLLKTARSTLWMCVVSTKEKARYVCWQCPHSMHSRVSVVQCLSVCPLLQVCCCGPAGRKHKSTAAWPALSISGVWRANAGSAMLSAYVERWTQTFMTFMI